MRTFRRGSTLIESLSTMLVLSVIGCMAYWGFTSVKSTWYGVIDANETTMSAREAMDVLAEHLRNAQPCRTSANGILNSVVGATGENEITYYGEDSSCTAVRYYISDNKLYRQVSGGTSTLVANNITAMSVTYYKSNSYFGTWATTMSPNAPTQAELPNLSGVWLSVTSRSNGQSVNLTSWVRFRNSPQKTKLDGT